MTAYTAIPDSDIDPDSPGTTGLFTLLRDNPIAIMEKASGAPVLANLYVVTAMLANDAVTKAKLANTSVIQANFDTLTGSAAGTTDNGKDNIALNPYCFFPMIHTTNVNQEDMVSGHTTDGNDPDLPRLSIIDVSAGDATSYDVDWRYVVA